MGDHGPRWASCSRRLRLTVGVVLGVLVGVTTVVPPGSERAVVAISRFGSGVRLLPPRVALSCLALESRVVAPREHGAAVLSFPGPSLMAGGESIPVTVRVAIEGHGRLPIEAGVARASGMEAAWTAWAAGAIPSLALDAEVLLAATPLWREIFPGDQRRARLDDLRAALAPSLAPLRVRRAELMARPDPSVVRAAAGRALAGKCTPGGRVIVLGLDALDWELLDELTASGAMPNMRRLVGSGAHAILDVPKPHISPVVWTTIATGVPPEVHGVLDFLEPDPAGGPPHPVSSASRKAPALWEMAAAAGRTTATVGWWATFPAEAPPRGTVYSDRLTEQLLGLKGEVPRLADPPEVIAAARSLAVHAGDVSAAMLRPLASISDAELAAARGTGDAWDDPVGGLAKLWAATLTLERLSGRELERGTDIVFSYLEGTDVVGHLFAAMRPPALPGVDPAHARRFAGVVDAYHAEVDRWIGRILADLAVSDTLVIVSDHGFTWGRERPRVPAGAHTATATWWHRGTGVFIAAGPSVARTRTRQRLGVLDVAPAILALAGLPRAAEMPRAAPSWLLAPAAAVDRDAVSYAALLGPRMPVRVELPAEAREEELAKLRALGYVAGSGVTAAAPPAAGARELPSAPPDRAEARRLTNLGVSQASGGERVTAERTLRRAIAADPSYAPAHYNLGLMLRKQDRLDESDHEIWTAIGLGVGDREMAVVNLALDHRERGNPDKAKEVFAEGRRRFPDSAPIWLNSGVFLGEQSAFAEARTCLERAVQLGPANPMARNNLAAALLALGDRDGARRQLAESLRLDASQTAIRRQLDDLGGPLPE